MCALEVSTSVIQITIGCACVIEAAVIIIACYLRVFCTVRDLCRRIRSADPMTSTSQAIECNVVPRESRGEEAHIAKTLFLFVIFAICWSPTVISVIINVITGQQTSHLAALIRVNALILETVLDAIVYADYSLTNSPVASLEMC